MKIISHRGFWKNPKEHNSMPAFQASFIQGFGVETDLRDYKGQLVISHDIPRRDALHAEDFFEAYSELGNNLPLALNIKSDGLMPMLQELLDEYKVQNYFVFDMSGPDTLEYEKAGLRYFSRHSDIEKEVILYDDAHGVWLDSFYSDWASEADINKHLKTGKSVCIVSPEIHGRDPSKFWESLRASSLWDHQNLMLCTDLPKKARGVFL